MHDNRKKYTLQQYQSKLRANVKSLGVCCFNQNENNYIVFHPIPATAWLPEGRSKYYRNIRKKILNVRSDRHYTFCTLTYSSRLYTPEQIGSRIKRDLDLFFKRLRNYDQKFEFFYVIELTKAGNPHIHLIFDRYIHWKRIKKSWVKITGCPVVKIKGIKGKNVFHYVTKYTTDASKQSEKQFEFLFKNISRLWARSRNFCLPAKVQIKNSKFQFLFYDFTDSKFTENISTTIENYGELEILLLLNSLAETNKKGLIRTSINLYSETNSELVSDKKATDLQIVLDI